MNKLDLEKNGSCCLLESIGVTKVYDRFGEMVTAVTDASLKINSAELITLYGPANSGKSTLLRILAGIEKPDVGEVLLKGEPYYEFGGAEQSFIRLHKYGLVAASICEMRHLDLLQNVAYPRIALGNKEVEAEQRAQELLKTLGLEKSASKNLTALPPYQQKLASLARSLINEPWIIFIDEPFAALSHTESEKMAETLSMVNNLFSASIVVATNDPIYLSKSEKAYLMDAGRLVGFDAGMNPVERLSDAIEMIKKKHKIER